MIKFPLARIILILTQIFLTHFSKDICRMLPYGAALSEGDRFSNAPAERWFGILKNYILKKQMNQKSSRVVRKIREHVIFITKEVQLGIGNKRCTKEPLKNCEKKDFDRGLMSQEYWNKKPKISQPSNFIGNQLKKLLNTNNKKIDELDVDNLICTYCRKC